MVHLGARHAVAIAICAMWMHSHANSQSFIAMCAAPVSVLVAVACVVCHVLVATEWRNFDQVRQRLAPEAMAFSYDDIVKRREWLRLVSYHFSHGSDLHLIFNMGNLLTVGARLEATAGSMVFALQLMCIASTHVLAMMAVGCLVRSRQLLPRSTAELLRDKVVGLSGILFAFMVIDNYHSPMSATWIGVPGLGLHVGKHFATVGQLLLIQVMVPNVSFIGHACGLAAGVLIIIANDMDALWVPEWAVMHLQTISYIVGWVAVLLSGVFWWVYVSGREPQFKSKGQIGTKQCRQEILTAISEDGDSDKEIDELHLHSESEISSDSVRLQKTVREGRLAKFTKKEVCEPKSSTTLGFTDVQPRFQSQNRLGGNSESLAQQPDRAARLAKFEGCDRKSGQRVLRSTTVCSQPRSQARFTGTKKLGTLDRSDQCAMNIKGTSAKDRLYLREVRAQRFDHTPRLKLQASGAALTSAPRTPRWKADPMRKINEGNGDSFMTGEHCNDESCGRLTFLPLFCDWCGRSFCEDHVDTHICHERDQHTRNRSVLESFLRPGKLKM